MQVVNCDFCSSTEYEPVHTLTDIRMGLPGEYTLVRCCDCGLLYLNPRPSAEELAPHYSQAYHCFCGAVEDQRSSFTRWAQNFGLRRRCKTVAGRLHARGRDSRRLLDVGCATGAFLNEMRRLPGWQVSGVELAASAVEYARQRHGLEVFQGSLLEAHFPEASFDAVTLWDVLEHTSNPSANLAEILRILKPGGLLVIKAPDPSSREARLFGAYWVGFEAPQHLFGFPPDTLRNKMIQIGFDPVDTGLLGSEYSTLMISLSVWLGKGGHAQLGKLARGLAYSTPARAAAAPLFYLLRAFGISSSKLYFAWRPQ